MLALLSDPNAWAAFVTLSLMEIVLGIDNIVFISIAVSRLPDRVAERARRIGLALALLMRIVMLLMLTWLIGLTDPVLEVLGRGLSWRDLILMAGGLFLMGKATREIHVAIEGEEREERRTGSSGFARTVAQVVVIDAVFSLDSIVTAIGMADDVEVMIAAVLVAIGTMYVASGPIAAFVKRNPTTRMLALAFLLLIGVALIADGLGLHIPRGYIYFGMGFAALVESFNVLARRRRKSARARGEA